MGGGGDPSPPFVRLWRCIMSISIQFYKCADDPRVLDKTLTNETTSATLDNYEPVSDITGYITVQSSRLDYNYCKINGKYYFITEKQRQTNGMLRLYLREDVLYTYRAAIKALPVVVGRNKLYKATELFDPELRTLARTQCFAKVVGSFSYDVSKKILVTVG